MQFFLDELSRMCAYLFFLFPLQSMSFISTFLVLLLIPAFSSSDNEQFRVCSSSFKCGIFANLSYPFWGGDRPQYCGFEGYNLTCVENKHPVLQIYQQRFHLIHLNQRPSRITIAPVDMEEETCPETPILDTRLFIYTSANTNISLFYSCNTRNVRYPLSTTFRCISDGKEVNGLYAEDESSEGNMEILKQCKEVKVPVLTNVMDQLNGNRSIAVNEIIHQGFEVQYLAYDKFCNECKTSGGKCGSSLTSPQEFVCFCPDRPYQIACWKHHRHENRVNMKTKVIIGVIATFVGVVLACTGCYLYQRRKKKLRIVRSTLLSRSISADDSSVDVEKGRNLFGIHLFTYAELEEATSYFDSAKELGDGGFGTVYYGKLQDGRAVAVKRLYENNYKRVEQFMNEVEILTRLRHHHLVSLFGCTSRHSRELLLVYEFVPNGTVADHLHGERAKPGALPWPIRLKIAIETAGALTYLHATDIIHRDVKTNNILLDNNFSVKVADFGLSRLFPTDVTHVSTAPQGTPGYVDPEYHQCYQLTEKSDVFSYGVVLIELISSLPAVDITRHRQEINLSTLAINKIQNHALHELVDTSLGFESDSTIREMITAVAEVAFQCLQSEKDMRPSMLEVLESLIRIQSQGYNSGKAEEMDIPAADVVLLKSGPLQLSPESETVNLVSRSTTSNTSS
ncbi:LEAF RUST 10 DISEASE-RESISTANCE LOCUS RECEPTOR-LIKE PROTEIN KINASE-like 1.2 isoform X2 [Carica papaya]|uniref:LEAF RUST 10 DISEASE-RESISTANCE LOCUS RECEPTOR-LIKE PROTEIN KINASE-like 1.2 isoform X2 n=1 Tax=Carica papaya TaxID=3649 RepID=UPI000B8C83F1|nr:LEAF RUST 10 DISEASE-RESISTANCE LOCUS RECEPTOR-LIKE PROTEIN KINASE-like 1.2 isoform X2 [Carica papaya]